MSEVARLSDTKLAKRFADAIERGDWSKGPISFDISCVDTLAILNALRAQMGILDDVVNAEQYVIVRRAQVLALLQSYHHTNRMNDEDALKAAQEGVVGMTRRLAEYPSPSVAEAVAAERERCAKIAEGQRPATIPDAENYARQILRARKTACDDIASLIRNRKE